MAMAHRTKFGNLPKSRNTEPLSTEESEVWRLAKEQYELIVSSATRGRKIGSGIANWAATLMLGAVNGPTVVAESADIALVVERESGQAVLHRMRY